MSRRRTPKKRVLTADPVYDSRLVHIIVNHLMKKGKKSVKERCYHNIEISKLAHAFEE